MRQIMRNMLIFNGGTLSAGLLSFVSIQEPYTAMQISILIIGSLTAGFAGLAVEWGVSKAAKNNTSWKSQSGNEPQPPISLMISITLSINHGSRSDGLG